MATKLNELEDLSCPLCGKTLASNEYLIAKLELEKKLAERYSIENKKRYDDYPQQLTDQKEYYDKIIGELKNTNDEQLGSIKKELKESYDKQLQELQKMQDYITKQNRELYTKKEKQLESDYEKEVADRVEGVARKFFQHNYSSFTIKSKSLQNGIWLVEGLVTQFGMESSRTLEIASKTGMIISCE